MPKNRISLTSIVIVFTCIPALFVSSCAGWKEMRFTQDTRLTITAPTNLQTVSMPFTVSWTWRGDQPQPRVAVFIDSYPMAPRKTLRDRVDTNKNCRGSELCLQPDYLSTNFGIYVTDSTQVRVSSFPVRVSTADSTHYATMILLNPDGSRQGESVWYVGFKEQS